MGPIVGRGPSQQHRPATHVRVHPPTSFLNIGRRTGAHHSIQVGARRLAAIIRGQAAERGFAGEVIDDIHDIMWLWATSYAAVINSVLQENALSAATRRSMFMRRLIEPHPPGRLAALLAENGLDAERRYYTAVADSGDPAFTSEVQARLRLRCGLAQAPVFDAVVDAWFVARAIQLGSPTSISTSPTT